MSFENCVMQAQFYKAETIKGILNVINQWTSNAMMNFNTSGVTLQAMDACQVSIVQMDLSRNFFRNYECVDDMALGINIDSLLKLLEFSDLSKPLTFQYGEDSDHLQIYSATGIMFVICLWQLNDCL